MSMNGPHSPGRQPPVDAATRSLAAAVGVATSYADWAGRDIPVPPAAVRGALAALGHDVDDPAAALAAVQDLEWGRLLPPVVVVRQGDSGEVAAHLPEGQPLWAWVEFEASGPTIEISDHEDPGGRRTVAGQVRAERTLTLPPHMPLGYHVLHLACGGETAAVPLIVVPTKLGVPGGRAWGWMAQLYAVRSAASWGIGDYGDLGDLARWAGHSGAGLLLVNPLHAPAPTLPVEDSPYSPSSRRVASPLYLRVTDLAAYAEAPPEVRRQVDALAPEPGEHIDRDATWTAVLAALELLYPYAPDGEPTAGAPGGGEQDGSVEAVRQVATFNVLAERYGPDWREWPEPLHDPASAEVAAACAGAPERLAFWQWVLRSCALQLAAAQRSGRMAGMRIGVVHDLAVGVDPGGADAWALQDVLAPTGWSVGAPPDSFNQQGQDWGLPPWDPRALAEAGYGPWRDVVRAVLSLGGGLRVDHVLGLFRLWWVPPGASAADGTYVSYDAAAMLGVLALEAARAQALVVAEDLGTVPGSAERELAERGLLGSVVLWFAHDQDDAGRTVFTDPAAWRELAMASLSTHDLPTAAGWLEQEHVRVRAALGVLGRPAAEEEEQATRERAALLDLLVDQGLLSEERRAVGDTGQLPDAWIDEVVLALHRLLASSRSAVRLAALGDAVGDRAQPNLPGVADERYPSWRLPVRDGTGRALSLEEIVKHPRVAAVADVMAAGTPVDSGA